MPAQATAASEPASDPALPPGWLPLGRLTLPGRPEHVRAARQFVARAIGEGHPSADAAVLLTSEIVTNAVIHSKSRLTGGTVTIVVGQGPADLLVMVHDDGPDLSVPVVRSRSGATSGNGLLLVETLADRWGYAHDEARTTVWFRLSSSAGSGTPDGGEPRQPPAGSRKPSRREPGSLADHDRPVSRADHCGPDGRMSPRASP